MIPSAVTTARRPTADYLPGTLTSLARAGFHDSVVFAEPHAPVPNGYVVVRNPDSFGPYPNFLRALRYLVESSSAEWLAVFQDDIELAAGLADWLTEQSPRLADDRTGVVSLYTSSAYHQESIGWHRHPDVCGPLAYGALAYVFPRHAALRFLEKPPRRGSRTLTDFSVGEFCKTHGIDYWMHSPSLVRHVGAESAISLRNTIHASPEQERLRQCAAWCADIGELEGECASS